MHVIVRALIPRLKQRSTGTAVTVLIVEALSCPLALWDSIDSFGGLHIMPLPTSRITTWFIVQVSNFSSFLLVRFLLNAQIEAGSRSKWSLRLFYVAYPIFLFFSLSAFILSFLRSYPIWAFAFTIMRAFFLLLNKLINPSLVFS